MHTKYLFSLSLSVFSIALGMYHHRRRSYNVNAVHLTGQAKDVCNDKHIIETTKLTTVTGKTITMQRFNCSNTVALGGVSGREPPHAGRGLNPVLRHSAAQCTQANCMCGIPITFSHCQIPAAPITASDCTFMANSFLSMNNPATFIIPSGQGAGLFVETCEAIVNNPINATIEYCFSDMGIATLQNTKMRGSMEAQSEGTFAGNTVFVKNVTP